MADLSVINNLGVVFPDCNGTEIFSYFANAAIAAGQSVYETSTGTVDLASANTAGHEQFRGLALQSVGAGQAVDVIQKGAVEGFDLSGLAYDALVFQSDNAGNLATVASGTKTVQVGRVKPMPTKDSSGNIKKVLWVSSDMIRNW